MKQQTRKSSLDRLTEALDEHGWTYTVEPVSMEMRVYEDESDYEELYEHAIALNRLMHRLSKEGVYGNEAWERVKREYDGPAVKISQPRSYNHRKFVRVNRWVVKVVASSSPVPPFSSVHNFEVTFDPDGRYLPQTVESKGLHPYPYTLKKLLEAVVNCSPAAIIEQAEQWRRGKIENHERELDMAQNRLVRAEGHLAQEWRNARRTLKGKVGPDEILTALADSGAVDNLARYRKEVDSAKAAVDSAKRLLANLR